MDSFSCILILRQSHLGLNMCYPIFWSRNVWFGSYLRRWHWNVWHKTDDIKSSKMTSKDQNCHPDVMHESHLIPPRLRWHFLAPIAFTEIPFGYARKQTVFMLPDTISPNNSTSKHYWKILKFSAGTLKRFLLLQNIVLPFGIWVEYRKGRSG